MAKAPVMKIQEGATVREMTAAEVAAAVSSPEPAPPRSAASYEAEARGLIAAAFGGLRRDSVNSYYTRLRGMAVDAMTAEQRSDVATLDAADDWEGAMLAYARGPALSASPLAWPAAPAGLADLVSAC